MVDSITRRIFDAKKDDGNLAGWLAKGDEDGPCNAQDLEPGFFSCAPHVAIVAAAGHSGTQIPAVDGWARST